MFDAKTRAATRTNLEGFGTAFAGRGESINSAIGAFRPLLRDVIPVMRNLAAPDTQLRRLSSSSGDTAAIVAPAAETQAVAVPQPRRDDVGAAARSRGPYIQDSISSGKPALDAGDRELPAASARSCATPRA